MITLDVMKKKEALNFTDLEKNEMVIDVEDLYEDFRPDLILNKNELRSYIASELSKLTLEQRLCIIMHYYDDLKIEEIAEKLNCKIPTVKRYKN